MDNLLYSRTVPGAISRGIVKRHRLLKKINDNIKKSLILICAPAGYGKTTLVQDLLSENSFKYSFKYSWLHVHQDMNDFYTFVKYLTSSLHHLNPEFGKDTLSLIETYRNELQLAKNLKRIINDVVSIFLNEFFLCFKEDIAVVIDDLGYIENSDWLSEAFGIIFENLPSNMHIIITSRRVPDFSFTVLKAKRNILKIETKDLTFREDEIDELLRNCYYITVSPEELQLLKDKIGGWITGIHLILQSFGSDFKKIRLDKIIILEDIFNYFTEDIFSSLEENVKNFLLKTALLDDFSEDLCNELISSESKKIISELLSKNIFIQENPPLINNPVRSFSYQLLFKEFLNSKINELKTGDEIISFYKEVYLYYLSMEDYLRAITFALKSGEQSAAVGLIIKHFQGYFDSGSLEIIWKWIENISETTMEQNPELFYFKSLMLKFYRGNFEKAIPCLDTAIVHGGKVKDKDFLIKCHLSKLKILISLGRISEALKNIEAIINIESSHENKAKILYLLAYLHYQNSDYEDSLKTLQRASAEIENLEKNPGAEDIMLDIYRLYGNIYLIRGEHTRSLFYYELVVKESELILDRFETYCNLTLLYAKSGKFDKAIDCINNAKELVDKIPAPIFKITYLLAHQSLKFEFGDYEGSIKLLEEMNTLASKINHKYYIYLSYSLIGDCYFYLNKHSVAEEYYDLAFKFVNEENKLEKMQYAVMKALLIKKINPEPPVEHVLSEAYEYYGAHNFIYDKTQVAFNLADYYLRTGKPAVCKKYLTEALNISAEKNYTAYLQRDFIDLRHIFDFALSNNIQKDFIKLLSSDIISKKYEDWISDDCRKRLTEISNSVYDIMLNAFGSGEIIIRGRVLDEAAWSKKKWKQIFIYLLLSPKMELTKEKIIDIYYPETPAESAENIFHQIVSKFRNLVNINAPKAPGQKASRQDKANTGLKLITSLISYEDKVLKVNNDLNIYVDSFEFEKLLKTASAQKSNAGKTEALKKAIDVYKGNFLEGNYETWCEELRTRYLSMFISACEELIALYYEASNYNQALKYSENLLKFDVLNLTASGHIIRCYEQLNKHKLAREKYTQLAKNYEDEYGESLPKTFTEKLNHF